MKYHLCYSEYLSVHEAHSLAGKMIELLFPGAFFCALSDSLSYPRIACAVEDAGFEIRDQFIYNGEPMVFATKPKDGGYLDNWLKYRIGLANCNIKIGTNKDKFPSNVCCDATYLRAGEARGDCHFGPVPLYKNHLVSSLLEYLIDLFLQPGQLIAVGGALTASFSGEHHR